MPPREVLTPASPGNLNRKTDRTPPRKSNQTIVHAAELEADNVTVVDEAALREEITRDRLTMTEKAIDTVKKWEAESARRDAENEDAADAARDMEDWWADRRRAKAVAEGIIQLHSPGSSPTRAAACVDGQAPAAAAVPSAPLAALRSDESEQPAEATEAPPRDFIDEAKSWAWSVVPLLGVAAALLITASRRA
jgi:hypothetical protein